MGSPPTPINNNKMDWMKEKCKKCWKHFQLEGKRCAAHETECAGTGVGGMGDLGHIQCSRGATVTETGKKRTGGSVFGN